MSVHADQRAGRAIRDVPRTKNTAGTSRSMESSKPSGAQQPQLPAAGAQRRRQHLSWPRPMRRCPARQWLAAELQPAHEPRRRQSAALRGAPGSCGRGKPARKRCTFYKPRYSLLFNVILLSGGCWTLDFSKCPTEPPGGWAWTLGFQKVQQTLREGGVGPWTLKKSGSIY